MAFDIGPVQGNSIRITDPSNDISHGFELWLAHRLSLEIADEGNADIACILVTYVNSRSSFVRNPLIEKPALASHEVVADIAPTV